MPEQINPDEVDVTEAVEESELLTTVNCIALNVATLQVTVDTLLRIVRNIMLTALVFILGYIVASMI